MKRVVDKISVLVAQNARAGRLLEMKRNTALSLLRQLSETGDRANI